MKHVFIINESTVASFYGIGKYVNELIYSLHFDFKIHIVSIYSNDTANFKIEKINNITYWHIPNPSVQIYPNKEKNRVDYYKIVVTLLKLYVKVESPIIFHINYIHCSLPLVKLLRSYFNCKIITTIHYMEWAFLYDGNIRLTKEKAKSDKILQKSIRTECELIKLSDKVICLTKDNANILPEVYDSTFDNIHIIANGIQDKCNREDKASLRKKHYFSSEEKIILFAGRLDEIKGLHFLIEAFKILLRKYKHYHLLIVGGGDFGKYISEVKDVAAKVTFTGNIKQEMLFEYMNMADIGVMPSLYEPFGYVAVEMLMHSLPIVATSSLKSILEDGVNCKIVPIEYTDKSLIINVELLAEAIENILTDEDLSIKLRKGGRKKFEDAFEISYFKKNMMEIYNSVLI